MYNGVGIKEFGYMRTDGSVHPNPELFAAKKEYFDKGWGEECEKFKKYIEEFKAEKASMLDPLQHLKSLNSRNLLFRGAPSGR